MSIQINTDLTRTYTKEEFEALPEFDELYELSPEGKLVKKMPGDVHSRITRRILARLTLLDPTEKLGVMWPNGTFDVGTGWMPIPDLGFMVASRVPTQSEKSIKGVPDLVVEVHSPSDLDSTPGRNAAKNKIGQWQGVGVRLIWAINPRKEEVEIYRQDKAEPIQILGVTDELEGAEIIPGFKMPIKALFDSSYI